MATFYSWPLPGEGVTAEELLMAEIRAALPGVNTYSAPGRRDAILAEIVRAVFNGQSLASIVATLATITDLRPTRIGLTQSVLTSVGNAAVTPDVSAGSYIQVNVNTAGAYTINNPRTPTTSGPSHNPSGWKSTTGPGARLRRPLRRTGIWRARGWTRGMGNRALRCFCKRP